MKHYGVMKNAATAYAGEHRSKGPAVILETTYGADGSSSTEVAVLPPGLARALGMALLDAAEEAEREPEVTTDPEQNPGQYLMF